MKENKQIKLVAIISYISIIFNIVSGIIYIPWMVNQIGKSDYGLYTLATSLINMLGVDFGVGSAVSIFISKYKSEGNGENVGKFLGK